MAELWNQARTAGMSGPGAAATGASDYFNGAYAPGRTGLAALGGDSAATQQLMNPYIDNVVGNVNKQYDYSRNATINSTNDAATRAGAFGGSRHGVAEGVALGELGRGHEATIADLYHGGFNDAMGRAGSLASFGMSGANANAGMSAMLDPAMRQFNLFNTAMGSMPHGSTTSSTNTPGHNGATGALGGAASGAATGSMFGPWGTAIGAGVGGLLGMFG